LDIGLYFLLTTGIKTMHFSQQQASRTGSVALLVVIVFLGGCTTLQQPANPSSSDNFSNQPGSVSSSSQSPTNISAANTSNRTPKEQFATIIGAKQDGWLPKVLADRGLKRGLTPTAVGKIIPGAEQVSEFGFSKVAVHNIPSLKQYEFYYAKDSSGNASQLESVRLQFEPDMSAFYSDLVEVASNKYGAAKPEDVKQQTIVWVGPDFVTAQLTKPVTNFDGYELNVSLEKE
jgi:hypothetical protein